MNILAFQKIFVEQKQSQCKIFFEVMMKRIKHYFTFHLIHTNSVHTQNSRRLS